MIANQTQFEEFSIEDCKSILPEDESEGDHLKLRIKVVRYLVSKVQEEILIENQSFSEIFSQVQEN